MNFCRWVDFVNLALAELRLQRVLCVLNGRKCSTLQLFVGCGISLLICLDGYPSAGIWRLSRFTQSSFFGNWVVVNSKCKMYQYSKHGLERATRHPCPCALLIAESKVSWGLGASTSQTHHTASNGIVVVPLFAFVSLSFLVNIAWSTTLIGALPHSGPRMTTSTRRPSPRSRQRALKY